MKWFPPVLGMMAKWSISDIIALVNCIFTGLFLLATIISVICAFRAYVYQKNRAQKEAAGNLARHYAESVIAQHSYVLLVMQYAGLEEQTKKLFPYDKLLQFNHDEMLTFIKEQALSYETVKDTFLHIDPEAIIKAKYALSNSFQERRNITNEYIITDNDTGTIRIGDAGKLQYDFHCKVLDLLNDLEWFSMSCRYGIADEEILYQSLHSTFLSTIWLVYFYISDRNFTNEDKLFTNIIWLFIEWRRRLMEIQKCAEEKRAQAQEKVDAAEGKRLEAERELKNATPEVHSGKPL